MTYSELEDLKRKAKMQEERAKAEHTLALSDPYAARFRAAHENAMERHSQFVQSSPNSYAPSERAAAEAYFRRRDAERERQEGRTDAAAERGTRERIAEYEMEGKRDYGLAAERERGKAASYASENTLKGIETQARSAETIARGREALEREIKAKELGAQDALSRRGFPSTARSSGSFYVTGIDGLIRTKFPATAPAIEDS